MQIWQAKGSYVLTIQILEQPPKVYLCEYVKFQQELIT